LATVNLLYLQSHLAISNY